MATILVDLDGPVANLLDEWLRLYNIDYDDDLLPGQIKSWDMVPYVRESCGKLIYEYLDGDIYDGVKPVDGALDGIKKLRELGHRVVFVTSAPEGTGDAKYAWLKRHGFLDDGKVSESYIEAHDKSLVRGDILIDDRVENIVRFPGETILWDAPYNRDITHGFRVKNWRDVLSDVSSLTAYGERIAVAPQKHPTEIKCPEQAAGFREIVERMYATHLNKNADYSPANILGTGELGLATRIWDKCIRYLNLIGFDIRAELVQYRGPQVAKNESIEDTLQDMSVYAIIGLLLRSGKWGR